MFQSLLSLQYFPLDGTWVLSQIDLLYKKSVFLVFLFSFFSFLLSFSFPSLSSSTIDQFLSSQLVNRNYFFTLFKNHFSMTFEWCIIHEIMKQICHLSLTFPVLNVTWTGVSSIAGRPAAQPSLFALHLLVWTEPRLTVSQRFPLFCERCCWTEWET